MVSLLSCFLMSATSGDDAGGGSKSITDRDEARMHEIHAELLKDPSITDGATLLLTFHRRVADELGLGHPHTVELARRLVSELEGKGQEGLLIELEKQWIQGLEILHGSEAPETLSAFNNLAVRLLNLSEFQSALKIQEHVVSVRRRVLDPEDPILWVSQSNLAQIYFGLGDLQTARRLQEDGLEFFERVLGPDHPHTLGTKSNLSITLSSLGELAAAQTLQEDALEAQNRLLGAEHPSTLTTRTNLADTLKTLGRLDEAIRHERDVLAALQRLHGSQHPKTLSAMSNLGSSLHVAGQLSEAVDLLRDSVDGARRALGPENPQTLTAMNNLAAALRDTGALQEVVELQERVFEAQHRLLGAEHPDTMVSMGNLAQSYSDLGDYDRAQELQDAVLQARRRVLGADHPETMGTENNLAETYRAIGDFERARSLHQNLLERRTRILGSLHKDTLASKSNLAMVLHQQGLYEESRQHLENVRAGFLEILGPLHPSTLTAQSNLANTMFTVGDYAGARKIEEEILQVRLQNLGPDHPQTLLSRHNLATTLTSMGALQEAREQREVAVERFGAKLGPDHPSTLKAKGGLASTLVALGDIAAARRLQQEVLEGLADRLGADHPDALTARAYLVETFRLQGELKQARHQQEEVLRSSERRLGKDHPETLFNVNNLAGFLQSEGQLDEAQKLYERALRGLQKRLGAEHPTVLLIRSNIASVHRDSDRWEAARDLYRQVLTARLSNLGPNHPDTRHSRYDLADTLWRLGRSDEAVYLLEQSLASRRDADLPASDIDVRTSWLLGLLYRRQGRPEDALALLDSTMDSLELLAARIDFEDELQNRNHTSKRVVYYETLAQALAQDETELAFNILERYRTFNLVAEQVRNGTLSLGGEPELQREIRSIGARYDALTERLSYLNRKSDPGTFRRLIELQQRLRRDREVKLGQLARERRNAPDFPKALGSEEIQSKLGADTALVAFSFGGFGHHTFVVTRDGAQAFQIDSNPEDLVLQIRHIYARLTEKGHQDTSEGLARRAAWLFEKLLGPAADILKSKQRWLILPDGELHYLPFGTLVDGSGARGNSWLVNRHALHISQSFTLYDELIQKRSRPRNRDQAPRWFALGDPVYGSEQRRSTKRVGYGNRMESLPNTRRELNAIEALFGERNQPTEAYFGYDANEDRLHQDLRGIDYIHIASHGVSLPNDPENGLHPSDSFLALTLLPEDERQKRGLKQNGLLQAWEIANYLQLDAELVVLSACETAIGENRGGEGLMSLARAFLQAGARSVLASLWKVDDLSTSELMIRFYRHLLDGESKVDALRLAQMELASGPIWVEVEKEVDGKMQMVEVEKDFTAPSYWAGFQLIGDWK